MDTPRTVEAFDFFSKDALKAGWYFFWRILLWTLLIGGVAGVGVAVLAGVLFVMGMASPQALQSVVGVLLGVLVVAAFVVGYVWVIVKVVNKIAFAWSLKQWGREPTQGVFLEILWRVIVVGILSSIANAIINLPVSLLLGDPTVAILVGVIMFVASLGVGILSYGWAMSAAVAKKLGSMAPVAAAAMAGPPMAAAMSAPPPPRTAPGERMQCPKCGLNETERGAVIGWYCKVCGWRESSR